MNKPIKLNKLFLFPSKRDGMMRITNNNQSNRLKVVYGKKRNRIKQGSNYYNMSIYEVLQATKLTK